MSHFEYMESAGQITIFDLIEPAACNEPLIQPGDTVKINIDHSDDEAINYFKYYYPHVINKAGTVIDSKQLRDKNLYLVNVYGETHWMYGAELTLL